MMMDIKALSDKLKKGKKNALYILIAAVAVLIMIILNISEKSKDKSTIVNNAAFSDRDYCSAIESELEKIISLIEGAGKTKVMLTVSGSNVTVYQSDYERSGDVRKEKTVVVGSKEALVRSTEYPEIVGVLVVCDGGKNISVKEKVINAVSTVLNISSNRVYVTN